MWTLGETHGGARGEAKVSRIVTLTFDLFTSSLLRGFLTNFQEFLFQDAFAAVFISPNDRHAEEVTGVSTDNAGEDTSYKIGIKQL